LAASIKGQDTAMSDIDLMVVSDRLTYADLFAVLEDAKELSRRVKQGNAFVTRLLAQPKLWVIGDESALAA
jgi:hypothetical protein